MKRSAQKNLFLLRNCLTIRSATPAGRQAKSGDRAGGPGVYNGVGADPGPAALDSMKSLRILALGLIAASASAQETAPAGKVDFVRDIQPIFKASCLKCHGPEKPKAQFRVDSRSHALKGGVAGKAILPGKGADSLLVKLLTSADAEERMPRKAEALTNAQIDLIRIWIDQGADWPDAAAGSGKAETHWAYVKPVRP